MLMEEKQEQREVGGKEGKGKTGTRRRLTRGSESMGRRVRERRRRGNLYYGSRKAGEMRVKGIEGEGERECIRRRGKAGDIEFGKRKWQENR